MIATAATVAIIFFSCKSRLSEAERLDLSKTPVQTVDDMYIIQSEGGRLQMRIEADVMEHYDSDTMSVDMFPKGLQVFSYNEEGELEAHLRSDNATHEKSKKGGEEIWKAYGNVVVKNIIKQETMDPGRNRDLGQIDTTLECPFGDFHNRISSERGRHRERAGRRGWDGRRAIGSAAEQCIAVLDPVGPFDAVDSLRRPPRVRRESGKKDQGKDSCFHGRKPEGLR